MQIVGRKAPRVNGMLLELPADEIKSLLSDWSNFNTWVQGASVLIDHRRRETLFVEAEVRESTLEKLEEQCADEMTAEQSYLRAGHWVSIDVIPENSGFKGRLNDVLYPYVVNAVGPKAPRVSGMLLELPIPTIRNLLRDYSLFCQFLDQASRQIDEGRRDRLWAIPQDQLDSMARKYSVESPRRAKSASKEVGGKTSYKCDLSLPEGQSSASTARFSS